MLLIPIKNVEEAYGYDYGCFRVVECPCGTDTGNGPYAVTFQWPACTQQTGGWMTAPVTSSTGSYYANVPPAYSEGKQEEVWFCVQCSCTVSFVCNGVTFNPQLTWGKLSGYVYGATCAYA